MDLPFYHRLFTVSDNKTTRIDGFIVLPRLSQNNLISRVNMIVVGPTEFSKNFKIKRDRLEFCREEIILIRNNHKIASIIPGPPHLTAELRKLDKAADYRIQDLWLAIQHGFPFLTRDIRDYKDIPGLSLL